jgi:hypothetical protein
MQFEDYFMTIQLMLSISYLILLDMLIRQAGLNVVTFIIFSVVYVFS